MTRFLFPHRLILPALCGALALFMVGHVVAEPRVDRREVGALVLENIPEMPGDLREALEPYLNTRSASFADWLPDGDGLLISTRFGETTQLHIVERPMGARRQVTFHREPVGSGRFGRVAEPNLVLISMDDAGSERSQIYLHDLRTGRATMLTDGESVNRGAIWANNSPTIAYTTTARNGRDWDIVLLDTADPDAEPRTVVEGEGMWFPLDFSPDDSRLLVLEYISINESRLFIAHLESGDLRRIHPDAGRAISYRDAQFARSGDGIFYLSDEESEFQRLRYHDVRHNATQSLISDTPWDVEGFALSDDGNLLAAVINEEGWSKLMLLDLNTLRLRTVDTPNGIIRGLSFHPANDRLAISLFQPTSPGDVYTMRLDDPGEWTQWTESEVGGLPAATFIAPQLVRYRTFDSANDNNGSRRIPAWVYRPRSGNGPHPVIIDIHGGPESQARPFFNSLRQFLLNELGVAVIVPNVRGSSGYGKSYLLLDNGMKREDSVRDIGALLDWIDTQPDLDGNRVVLTGGSYGGYMVLASMAMFPERVAGGINIVGISNFVTFLENTSDYRRDARRVEYGDERDPEMRDFLESISPTNNAHRIASPLFVVHGYNDPRVPVTEAEQILEAVRDNGIEAWYFLAMNEGHGLRRKENADAFREAAVMFFRHVLLGEHEWQPEADVPSEEVVSDSADDEEEAEELDSEEAETS